MGGVLRKGMVLAAALVAGMVEAKSVEQIVDYTVEGQPHRGYAYYDDQRRGLPVLIVVPNWMGTTAANRAQAREIAGDRYFVFVADMFGRDRQPADAQAAGQRTGALYADRERLRRTARAARTAAIEAIARHKLPADASRVAIMGFCFGGTTALELARSGEPLAAAVSVHGGLTLDAPAENRPLRTRILALHGDADPFVPPAQLRAFEAEMRAAGADWQLVIFGGAVHSFTDPNARMPGKAEFHPRAARRAFALVHDFLGEAFGGAP